MHPTIPARPLVGIGLAVLAGWAGGLIGHAAPAQRPNVIFVLADDPGLETGNPEILNASFEDPPYTSGVFTGWSCCLAGESSIKHNPVTDPPTPQFHDGQNSAGMSSDRPGDNLGAGAIFQEVEVTPGRTYRVRCWGTLTEAGGQHTDDFMQLRIRDGDGTPLDCGGNGANVVNNSDLYAHLDGQPSTEWTLLEGDITPTENAITVIAYWEFAGSSWEIESLHLDDWSIEDVTPSVVHFSNFQSSRAISGDVYDISSDAPCGAVEWRHPRRGLLPLPGPRNRLGRN